MLETKYQRKHPWMLNRECRVLKIPQPDLKKSYSYDELKIDTSIQIGIKLVKKLPLWGKKPRRKAAARQNFWEHGV